MARNDVAEHCTSSCETRLFGQRVRGGRKGMEFMAYPCSSAAPWPLPWRRPSAWLSSWTRTAWLLSNAAPATRGERRLSAQCLGISATTRMPRLSVSLCRLDGSLSGNRKPGRKTAPSHPLLERTSVSFTCEVCDHGRETGPRVELPRRNGERQDCLGFADVLASLGEYRDFNKFGC